MAVAVAEGSGTVLSRFRFLPLPAQPQHATKNEAENKLKKSIIEFPSLLSDPVPDDLKLVAFVGGAVGVFVGAVGDSVVAVGDPVVGDPVGAVGEFVGSVGDFVGAVGEFVGTVGEGVGYCDDVG